MNVAAERLMSAQENAFYTGQSTIRLNTEPPLNVLCKSNRSGGVYFVYRRGGLNLTRDQAITLLETDAR